MDVNVTHPIAANVALVQYWWVPWIPAFIGVIGAIFGAFAAGIATYYIEKLKIKNVEFEKRKQIYSRLNGIIALINQIMYLHGESTIDSTYFYTFYESKIPIYAQQYENNKFAEIERLLKEIPDRQQGDEEKEKSEKYALKAGQIYRQLGEIIGLILVSFDNTVKLDDLINELHTALRKYHKLSSEDFLKVTEGVQLDQWRGNKKTDLRDYLEKEFNPAVGNLEAYLKGEILKEDDNSN